MQNVAMEALAELEQVLAAHAERYPQMQPTDAVKLIYQNEFGGGHMIRDEQSCLEYLRREYASVQKDSGAMRYETIGNGILRVHLAAVPEEELEALGRQFIDSAARHRGFQECFREKLALLRRVTEAGVFAFGLAELDAYLADYEKAGFPAVSHSSQYRAAYHPAYRVITER